MRHAFELELKQVRACTLCATHLPLGPRPVVQLHPHARILIAGQAPGRKVHETGIAFDDPSGQRLRDWMGISREQFYDPEKVAILPMGFCYPGSGKAGDLAPRPECAEHWRRHLFDLLTKIQLTLVIGQYAHDWHLGDTKKATLTETVKAWQDYWPAVLPLPHPSPRNNIWLRKNPWFQEQVLPMLKAKISENL